MVQTADQVVDLVPISKPLGVKVASPQPLLAQGAALLSPSNRLMAADADPPALEQQEEYVAPGMIAPAHAPWAPS